MLLYCRPILFGSGPWLHIAVSTEWRRAVNSHTAPQVAQQYFSIRLFSYPESNL